MEVILCVCDGLFDRLVPMLATIIAGVMFWPPFELIEPVKQSVDTIFAAGLFDGPYGEVHKFLLVTVKRLEFAIAGLREEMMAVLP